MAGEWSKKIGEEGEKIALKLMDIIGWSDIQKGLDIPCIDNDNHKRKKEHGLDGLFSYQSPLHSRRLNHVLVSVKFSLKGYPNGLSSLFKDHLRQLNNTIECFDESEMVDEINQEWIAGITKAETIGLLIWLHGDREEDRLDDLIEKMEGIQIPADIELKYPIFVLDQCRANFIFESQLYVKNKFKDHKITFNYHDTGLNYEEDDIDSDGSILPVEIINSGVLVYRAVLQTGKEDDIAMIFASIEKIDEEGFKKMLGLALKMCRNLSNKIEICFPDYDEVRFGNQVQKIKASFRDSTFTSRVKVLSYKMDMRNL